MDLRFLLEYVGPHAAALIVAFLSAVFPVVNIEVFLVAAAVIASGGYPVWTLGVVAGFGQMCGNCVLYWGAGSALQSRLGRRVPLERVDALRRRMDTMTPWWLAALSFVSALVGMPPFLLFSMLAGMISMNFWQYCVTGLTGRTLRLVAIVVFPHVLKGLLT